MSRRITLTLAERLSLTAAGLILAATCLNEPRHRSARSVARQPPDQPVYGFTSAPAIR